MELSLLGEFVRSAISLALPASDQPRIASPAPLINSCTRVDAGLNAQPFPCKKWAKTPPALTPAQMVSSRYLKLNVLPVLLSAPLAQDWPKTAPPVFMDQSQSTAAAPLCAVRTSSASKDSVLLAQLAATDAKTTLKVALTVLKGT